MLLYIVITINVRTVVLESIIMMKKKKEKRNKYYTPRSIVYNEQELNSSYIHLLY